MDTAKAAATVEEDRMAATKATKAEAIMVTAVAGGAATKLASRIDDN